MLTLAFTLCHSVVLFTGGVCLYEASWNCHARFTIIHHTLLRVAYKFSKHAFESSIRNATVMYVNILSTRAHSSFVWATPGAWYNNSLSITCRKLWTRMSKLCANIAFSQFLLSCVLWGLHTFYMVCIICNLKRPYKLFHKWVFVCIVRTYDVHNYAFKCLQYIVSCYTQAIMILNDSFAEIISMHMHTFPLVRSAQSAPFLVPVGALEWKQCTFGSPTLT